MLSERESGEIKKGLLDMVVLCLLKGEDKYSYQLRQEIVGKSQGNFTVTSAALYTVLYRLEREGFLTRRVGAGITRDRMYYHLEPAGEAFLQNALDTYNAIHKGIRLIAGDLVE